MKYSPQASTHFGYTFEGSTRRGPGDLQNANARYSFTILPDEPVGDERNSAWKPKGNNVRQACVPHSLVSASHQNHLEMELSLFKDPEPEVLLHSISLSHTDKLRSSVIHRSSSAPFTFNTHWSFFCRLLRNRALVLRQSSANSSNLPLFSQRAGRQSAASDGPDPRGA
jgi:hypothetical protein